MACASFCSDSTLSLGPTFLTVIYAESLSALQSSVETIESGAVLDGEIKENAHIKVKQNDVAVTAHIVAIHKPSNKQKSFYSRLEGAVMTELSKMADKLPDEPSCAGCRKKLRKASVALVNNTLAELVSFII